MMIDWQVTYSASVYRLQFEILFFLFILINAILRQHCDAFMVSG